MSLCHSLTVNIVNISLKKSHITKVDLHCISISITFENVSYTLLHCMSAEMRLSEAH